jgi:hypothetical protein
MWLKVYERRKKWYWRLFDRKHVLVAQSPRGYRSFALAKDYARFVRDGLQNCLR